MKAKIKTTSEIVEIESYDIDKLGKLKYFTKDFDVYDENEVEIILERALDYWTRLEHQAAIAAMQEILSNHNLYGSIIQMTQVSRVAIDYAQELVEKMKEE